MRPCGYCSVDIRVGTHHRPDCTLYAETSNIGPDALRRGDVVKTWWRRKKTYVNYTVIDVRDHEEGGQVVVATSRYGAWRFRWWPGNLARSRWIPVFVRRPP